MTQYDPNVSEAAAPARFTADEFLRMFDADVFGDRSVELVHGEIIELSPARFPHSQMVSVVIVALSSLFGARRLAADSFLRLDEDSVRAFDVAVVREGVAPAAELKPEDVLLGVEIAHSSVQRDLGEKMRHYAVAEIRTYMVVEVGARIVHLMTGPGPDGFADHRTSPFGTPIPLPNDAGALVID